MFNWYVFIGSMIYMALGFIFHMVVADYIRELENKVAEVNYRFVNKMRFTIVAETKKKKDILVILLYMVWPIVLIAAILKAEYWYDSVVRRGAKRVS